MTRVLVEACVAERCMRCCVEYACCKHFGRMQEVRDKEVQLQSGDVLPYGLCVWSTGVGAQRLPSVQLAATIMTRCAWLCALGLVNPAHPIICPSLLGSEPVMACLGVCAFAQIFTGFL